MQEVKFSKKKKKDTLVSLINESQVPNLPPLKMSWISNVYKVVSEADRRWLHKHLKLVKHKTNTGTLL